MISIDCELADEQIGQSDDQVTLIGTLISVHEKAILHKMDNKLCSVTA